MLKILEKTAKTEEEAVSAALRELGVALEQVKVEVLEKARAGFLGIGSAPARVRVSYEEPEQPAEPQKSEKAPEGDPQEKVTAFLEGLFQRMEVAAEIRTSLREDGGVAVELEGEEIGALIGRRGETLDAIQHLCNYAVNRGDGQRIRVSIDAENYRKKREDSLVSHAKKVAEKVLRYRKSITMEPMNAYERHIVHTALKEVAGVTTFSTGSEPNRRVVVGYDAATAPQRSRGDSRERGYRGGRDSRRRSSSYNRPAPVYEPEDEEESQEEEKSYDPAELIADLGEDKSNSREWC